MKRLAAIGIPFITAVLCVSAGPAARAQQTSDPPAAPKPAQIFTGTKVFIANAESATIMGVPDLTYNEFYAGMKAWGKYELVASPADADLVLEIRFGSTGGENLMSAFTTGTMFPAVRVTILDPKTHVLLWGLTEYVQTANRVSTARKNFDKAISAVIDSLKNLTSTPSAATTTGAPNK